MSQKEKKAEPPVPGFACIPHNEAIWENLVEKAGLVDKRICDLKRLGSGSEITERQFLMLRVLMLRIQPFINLEACRSSYGLDQVWNEATEIVGQSQSLPELHLGCTEQN
jgi:hypothetical protein